MEASLVFRIVPTIQKYDWGKVGRDSTVAKFFEAGDNGVPFSIEPNQPYAELWMGTHPTSPSHVYGEPHEPLSTRLSKKPDFVGRHVVEKLQLSNGSLPFLFKVLSVNKALSIQTHPNKAEAEHLHATRPDIYKDPYPKPEMAIALTPFYALCGFRPLSEIAAYLRSTPEYRSLIPDAKVEAFLAHEASPTPEGPAEKAALRELFTAVMTAEGSVFKEQLNKLASRYQSGGALTEERPVVDLVVTLNKQYPGDIGVFCAFMLNYTTLQPGEAIFLGAGEPHCYLQGDILECMANSDNVIRAGLTPKLRDVPNLLANLTYTASPPSKHTVAPQPFGDYAIVYDPPTPEFAVSIVNVGSGKTAVLRVSDGPSICLVGTGKGTVHWSDGALPVSKGHVFFVSANLECKFQADGGENLVVCRAFTQV
ncbi:mannose-6-phosphate isomerase [Fistulina hepatica ATCC 64428]|uniref:Mannose-6-phosphate isomerase n=1 Tax=Fistulina hepatica ATCC 64428 TaxID=1128425 RepID=A0A0D7ANG2_9AGAR|nr:mannose-6-phosphate isomerase [Fistulina hepatica ATCC 64428]